MRPKIAKTSSLKNKHSKLSFKRCMMIVRVKSKRSRMQLLVKNLSFRKKSLALLNYIKLLLELQYRINKNSLRKSTNKIKLKQSTMRSNKYLRKWILINFLWIQIHHSTNKFCSFLKLLKKPLVRLMILLYSNLQLCGTIFSSNQKILSCIIKKLDLTVKSG